MSQALIQTKKRIKSVESTSKITKSMKLVSTAKLKTHMKNLDSFKIYSNKLNELVSFIASKIEDLNSPLFLENNVNKKLVIVVTSSLGLCGSYNHNIFSYVDKNVKENDDVLILGNKGISHYRKAKFNLINIENFSYGGIKDALNISRLNKFIVSKYLAKEYGRVELIYTKYINSIKNVVSNFLLLPISKEFTKVDENLYPPIFEPSKEEIINELSPLYLESNLYSLLLNSEVSEQSSRRNAMENATNNALDLKDKLELEFNKARQSAITQEIIEVSSASNNDN